MDTTGARSFAMSMHMLADIAESNARYARDQRLSDAFTNAATAMMDAANELRVAADNVDGVWALDLVRAA
jgi:hypothetical protein